MYNTVLGGFERLSLFNKDQFGYRNGWGKINLKVSLIEGINFF